MNLRIADPAGLVSALDELLRAAGEPVLTLAGVEVRHASVDDAVEAAGA